jgi:hypothetical protein
MSCASRSRSRSNVEVDLEPCDASVDQRTGKAVSLADREHSLLRFAARESVADAAVRQESAQPHGAVAVRVDGDGAREGASRHDLGEVEQRASGRGDRNGVVLSAFPLVQRGPMDAQSVTRPSCALRTRDVDRRRR